MWKSSKLTTPLVRSFELGEPRQSGVFFEPSLRADDRGEGCEAVATGSRQVMVVELAEAFFLAKAVELGGVTMAAAWSAGRVNWA